MKTVRLATMILPFDQLGKTPQVGDQWRIVLIRGSKPEACAFPFPAYHDMTAAATIYFSGLDRPERRLTWISKPLKTGKPRFDRYRSTLLKNGWHFQHGIGVEKAMEMNFSDSRLILIENYQNNFPLEFYREKLIPAVKGGAVVLFRCYFWIDKLHQQFDDPTFETQFIEKVNRSRKVVTLAENSFASYPHDLRKVLKTTPSSYFEPVYPENWEVLATQYSSENEEKPFLLARPLGRGMVVLSGDFYDQLQLLDNLLEYNRHIER